MAIILCSVKMAPNSTSKIDYQVLKIKQQTACKAALKFIFKVHTSTLHVGVKISKNLSLEKVLPAIFCKL